jgi:8-oxo-dGTP pyrophosphatase MutT (NUDIX family)
MQGNKGSRPKDAATLVLYRRRASGALEVLMGLRHERHVFQPNTFVFPGGRVERGDGAVRAAAEPPAGLLAQLQRGGLTPARARGHIMAAIRETFEECGLRIADTDPQPRRAVPEEWRHFFDGGVAPLPQALVYFCRAITPPYPGRRYDTRFFIAPADAASGTATPSRELTDVRWVDFDEAGSLPLPNMTRRILPRLQALFADLPRAGDPRPVMFYRSLHGKRQWSEQ